MKYRDRMFSLSLLMEANRYSLETYEFDCALLSSDQWVDSSNKFFCIQSILSAWSAISVKVKMLLACSYTKKLPSIFLWSIFLQFNPEIVTFYRMLFNK